MISIIVLTLRELVRRKFVLAAVVITAVLLGLTGWGFAYLTHARTRGVVVPSHQEVLQISAMLVILIAYLFSFIVAVLSVFLAAPSLANDIESGVLLPVLTRPLSRHAVIGGKAIALAIVVCVYAGASGAAEFLVVRMATGYVPPHPAACIAYLCLLSLAMLVLAIALSTRLSAIAASVVAILFFGIAWMGGIAQSLGMYYGNPAVRDAGTITQLVLPTDAMWRSAVFQLEPAVFVATMSATHVWPGPFFVVAPPPAAVAVWTLGWIAVVYAIGARRFALRDL